MWKINEMILPQISLSRNRVKDQQPYPYTYRNLVIFLARVSFLISKKYFSHIQEKSTDYLCTVNLFLHFALRRARILRPVQLDILSRNPCLFILDLRLYFLILFNLLAIWFYTKWNKNIVPLILILIINL